MLHQIIPTTTQADLNAELLAMCYEHNFDWKNTDADWEYQMRLEQKIVAQIHYLVGVLDLDIPELIAACIAEDPTHEEQVRAKFAYWTRPL
jgi:hypothetical protein